MRSHGSQSSAQACGSLALGQITQLMGTQQHRKLSRLMMVMPVVCGLIAPVLIEALVLMSRLAGSKGLRAALAIHTSDARGA